MSSKSCKFEYVWGVGVGVGAQKGVGRPGSGLGLCIEDEGTRDLGPTHTHLSTEQIH